MLAVPRDAAMTVAFLASARYADPIEAKEVAWT
jgi:hypothetical protein